MKVSLFGGPKGYKVDAMDYAGLGAVVLYLVVEIILGIDMPTMGVLICIGILLTAWLNRVYKVKQMKNAVKEQWDIPNEDK